jgi:hypothetical protein
VAEDRLALQVLREWLARAALRIRQDRLKELDTQDLQVLLERRGLPDFPALLGQLGLLDPEEPPAPPALQALRELLDRKAPKGFKGRSPP